ncbi:hypothetical protein A3A56_01920, partial [Candidatus Roizmanbacteria bacterium RIFCSPLOWO2_01_FULL_40_32]
NKVILIGNLTRDPELKYTPSGTAVCTIGLATNRSWKTAEGETKEDVQFHRIVAWQKLAELCGKFLSKGRKVYLEGRIVYRTFTGKDGLQKNMTEIIMEDFVLFDDRRREGGETGENVEEAWTSAPSTAVNAETDIEEAPSEDTEKVDKKKVKETKEVKEDVITDDDIPF